MKLEEIILRQQEIERQPAINLEQASAVAVSFWLAEIAIQLAEINLALQVGNDRR